MIDSIFNRVYSYRERENNSPLENFLTEIFAYCLETDERFRNDFLNILLKHKGNPKLFQISTQQSYEGYGRPDIEISCDNDTVILIECKVESSERENQLNDYCKILSEIKNGYKTKFVVFLTKYYEYRDFESGNINLLLIRWFEIYELIDQENDAITQQLKQFLKEQGMEKVKNFTIQDMLAMKTISETMTKMDELLEQFKTLFEKEFGAYSKDSSRSTRLPNNLYINYVTLNYEKQPYWLLIGFFWWWSEIEIPLLGITIEIPHRKFENSELIKILRSELVDKKGWEYEDSGKMHYISSFKPITEFINLHEDNVPAMRKYLKEQLEVLIALKTKYPKILTK